MRYILIVLALCFFVISVQAGTFRDDFEDGNLDGWEIKQGAAGAEWKVEDGVLKSRCQDTWSELLFGEQEWHNYSLEYDAKMLEASNPLHAMCAVLRVNWEGFMERAVLSGVSTWQGKNAWIQVWFNDVNLMETKKGFDFQLNQWYHFKHIVNENNFELYIDGKLLASLSDSHISTGRLGLEIFFGCVVYFDNVIITGDDVPDNPQSIDYHGKLATAWGQIKN
jgi:hypothetical protein